MGGGQQNKYNLTQACLYYALRSEQSHLPFGTESGGTSYGKLSSENIENLLISEILNIGNDGRRWQ